jgi:hypothetical protein
MTKRVSTKRKGEPAKTGNIGLPSVSHAGYTKGREGETRLEEAMAESPFQCARLASPTE